MDKQNKNNSIFSFYQDAETRDNVKNYLIEFLEGIAIKKVFNREDTNAVAEAKECIEKAFNNLDNLFQPKVKPKEQINQSR